MGMVLGLRKLTKADIENLHAHPGNVMAYLFGEEANNFDTGTKCNVWDFLKGLFIKKSPVLEEVVIPEALEEDEIDLDKSWHILHYIFTGSANGKKTPGCYLLEGGSVINSVEIGYGAAYTLNPDQVKDFSDFLFQFDEQAIEQRFDIEDMKKQKIYIAETSSSDKEELLSYTLEYFEILKTFIAKAVKEEKGLLLFMC